MSYISPYNDLDIIAGQGTVGEEIVGQLEGSPVDAALYDALAQVQPSPVVELNRAVAVGRAFGPGAGLDLVEWPDARTKLVRRLSWHGA
jgi:hypothetical protein